MPAAAPDRVRMDSPNKNIYNGLLWLLLGVIAWPSATEASDPVNPYRAITKRNAFSLGAERPPAKPLAKRETKQASDIKLTGIFQRNGVERAAIAVLEPSDKSAKPKFMQLAKGEQREHIRVEKIDRRNGTVALTVNGARRELNFKDDAYASTLTKSSRTSSSARRPLPSKESDKDKKEKKDKKTNAEKLAKIDDSLARGKISQTSAELKAAVIKGEISGERANLASMLENGLIDSRAYEALSRLDDQALKASLSELKQARKLDKNKAPKQKKKK